jgi:arabinosaccharide transport system substrate-binding protein
MPDLAGKIVTEPLPVWEEGELRSVGQGGTGTSVTNQADDPDLTKAFLSFCKLSKEGGIKEWTLLGFDPIRTEVWAMDEVTHDPDNTFVKYYVNNPFDTLLQIKDEVVAVNNNETLPTVLDTMKTVVLQQAYESTESIADILADAQATAEAEAG